jgi:hypothetical protein
MANMSTDYVKEKLRKFGWRGLFAAAYRLALERLYRKDHYFLFSKATETFKLSKPTTLLAAPISEENTILFAPTFPYRRRIFLDRLSRGLHGFFYMREDGSPMGYHWYVLGRDYFEKSYRWTFHLQKAEAYLFDGYLIPAGRGSSFAVQAFAHTQSALRRLGVEKMFSVSDKNNSASWRFQLHLGFEIGGCLEVTRLLTRAVSARTVDHRQFISAEMRATIDRHARRAIVADGLLAERY